jgi:hypothetical protein
MYPTPYKTGAVHPFSWLFYKLLSVVNFFWKIYEISSRQELSHLLNLNIFVNIFVEGNNDTSIGSQTLVKCRCFRERRSSFQKYAHIHFIKSRRHVCVDRGGCVKS